MMAARGFAAGPVAPSLEAIAHDDHLGRTPPQRLRRAMGTFSVRAPHELADLRAAVAAERPTCCWSTAWRGARAAVAEGWGGPWAQWFPYPLPLSSRDVPPFGPGLAPRARAARAGCATAACAR